jgi:serine protease Do
MKKPRQMLRVCTALWLAGLAVYPALASDREEAPPAVESTGPDARREDSGTAAKEQPGTGEAGARQGQGARRGVPQLARMMRRSLVKITQLGREGVEGLGTGFIISADGLVATNLHVIGEARDLRVETAEGRELVVESVHATDSKLDLAILKVAGEELRPLRLGDSDVAEQGDRVVAMGNPEGLEFSVVAGVLSAVRDTEIQGVPMLQVAVPIERGNSGGPVLNEAGEVIGVLTLKSLRTDNLGFAMPVNGLKALIDSPNPVPMERWLTIGALDKRHWEPLMGGRWTQRAGVIHVESPGQGFGGRALCLARDEPDGDDFEAAVNVRLDDERGAAGLVFCADGGDRHYGFYPSGGKLRLTRFDGPDVYSWTILADVPSTAYRPGDWNHLRVRVTDERILCWVNGRELLDVADSGLRGGRAGLCKFRDTKAGFRGFRMGPDLSPAPVPEEIAGRVRAMIDDLLDQPAGVRDAGGQFAPAEAAAARRAVIEQRREIERAVAALRDLERDLHRNGVIHDILTELAKSEEEVNLLRCALLLARYDNPEVDVPRYLQVLERLAADVRDDPALTGSPDEAVARLNEFLFEENGFHGSRSDYSSRSNSYVNEVLEDREGLPITLSVVYLELARALGLRGIFGLGLPGRFMVGYHPSPDAPLRIVDPFNRGKLLTVEDAEAELNDYRAFPDEMLQPAGKRAILLRMIKNLLSQALDAESPAREALPYLNLYLAINPESASERFARARLLQASGDRAGARQDVAWLIGNGGELPPGIREQLQTWLKSLE